MFSVKCIFLAPAVSASKLLSKNQLSTLDYAYNAQPFCRVVSNNQTTTNLDIAYNAQPYVGAK